ncbi:hypothetical protein HWV62_3693 [Athelia sp. TMB]|nr:hypothetical protein HWV62_3693 [Athelia sp. TMB]
MATILGSTPEAAGSADPAAYCRDLVQKHDYESFLTSHFYPREVQGGYFALKAFYVELAMIQDTVSNPMLGKMRMQFWRDTVKQINEGKPPRHPIALALFEASRSGNIPAYHLKRIIDARDEEIQAPPHLTTDTLTSHAESTSSTLLYALLSYLSIPSSSLSHAASHIGVAQTFATLLRALPFHAARGRMVIPAEITAKHKVNQQDVFRAATQGKGKGTLPVTGLEDAVFEFATVANDHTITARDMLKETGGQVPAEAMPIFLTAVPVVHFLTKLEAANFDPFHPSLLSRDWKLPWHVWKSHYQKTF